MRSCDLMNLKIYIEQVWRLILVPGIWVIIGSTRSKNNVDLLSIWLLGTDFDA